MQAFLEKLRAELIEANTALNVPADGASIGIFENVCRLKLPDDFKQLYRVCNGFGPDGEDNFHLLPLNEAAAELIQYGTGKLGSRFVLAEYMLYCDWWEVELTPNGPNAYQIVNAGHESGQPLVLTSSLAEFLTHYLAGGVFGEQGLYAWHAEIEQRQLQRGS